MKLSTIVLAAQDLNAGVAFYEAMGFRRQQGGGALAFLSDGERTLALAKADIVGTATGKGTPAPGTAGAPAAALVFLAKSNAEVDETIAKAHGAGATMIREASEGAWGGYSGSFADPSGHVWAVIHNPGLYRG